MLSYDIRQLQQQAVRVEGELAPDDSIWAEGDPIPAAPIHATGRLSKAGNGRYYWSGRIEGAVNLECRRCLAELVIRTGEEVHVLFVEALDDIAGDPDTFQLPPHAQVIDLRPAVREQWLLSAPSFALCREECKGLCAKCGADLNAGPCDCPPETDSRWNALRTARGASD